MRGRDRLRHEAGDRAVQPGFDGKPVRNHAKFLVVDHRFVLVTSANFSWSAEQHNVEFGVQLDNPNLAGPIEEEMRRAEPSL